MTGSGKTRPVTPGAALCCGGHPLLPGFVRPSPPPARLGQPLRATLRGDARTPQDPKVAARDAPCPAALRTAADSSTVVVGQHPPCRSELGSPRPRTKPDPHPCSARDSCPPPPSAGGIAPPPPSTAPTPPRRSLRRCPRSFPCCSIQTVWHRWGTGPPRRCVCGGRSPSHPRSLSSLCHTLPSAALRPIPPWVCRGDAKQTPCLCRI